MKPSVSKTHRLMKINLDAIQNEYHAILQLINSQNADSWKGFENGDDIPKFQGRKLRQAALTMLLVSQELETGIFMTDDERRNLFYSHVRLWCDEMNGSLTTRLSLPSIPNIWKCLDATTDEAISRNLTDAKL